MSAMAQLASQEARSLAAVYREMVRDLRAADVASPELDARLLVCAACGLSHEAFVAQPQRTLADDECARLAALVERRRRREPVSRILGRREFWGRDFHLGPETLDPRPDSETLVAAALETLGAEGRLGEPLSVLDLGTGTGCLLLSLLAELPCAHGVGVDVSASALAVASGNASRLGLADRARFVRGTWTAGLGGAFDVIVANPPYIRSRDIDRLAPEVARHEPRLALDGGADGLDAYRAIALDLRRVLSERGLALFEVGAGQGQAVARLFGTEGLTAEREPRRDLSGVPRCLVVRRFDPTGELKKEVGKGQRWE